MGREVRTAIEVPSTWTRGGGFDVGTMRSTTPSGPPRTWFPFEALNAKAPRRAGFRKTPSGHSVQRFHGALALKFPEPGQHFLVAAR